MSYRLEKTNGGSAIVIDGWNDGISASPYEGIANVRNLNTNYYPSVAYTNYKRKAATLSGTGFFYAGSHSVDEGDNTNWIFSSAPSNPVMTNPVGKAISPVGRIYILDDSGQVWKQSAVNSSTFTILDGGTGRIGDGHSGIAYWNNYLVVFGGGLIEFCGLGTNDDDIISSNWNKNGINPAQNTGVIVTHFATNNNIYFVSETFSTFPKYAIGDPVQFTTTGVLPTGLSLNTTYYIIAIVSTNQLQISTTVGGSSVTITGDGTGTHTITDYANPAPLGNISSFTVGSITVGSATMTISSYVDPLGVTQNTYWYGASGLYNIVMTDGQVLPANFVNGSTNVTLLSPLVYYKTGAWTIRIIDPSVTDYRPYVSKVDGSLYFCNGQFIGRIATATSPNILFNPSYASTYSVSYGVTSLPEQNIDTVVDMTDLKSQLVVAGQRSIYTWDYISASTSSPSPIGEQIFRIANDLGNIYILAGQKGNIYLTNGYSVQFLYKIPDYISGVIDPVFSWGDMMVHRSKLFFQALIKSTSGTNLLAGVFSLVVSPTVKGFVMEAQNSYGLTPTSGALSSGVLVDNSPSSTGFDSFYSAWSNGAAVGGVDYNDTTPWGSYEPLIETDIIPIGTILEIQSFGNVEFKLDRPMISGDSIRLSWRPSLSDSYTLIGTTTSTQLSDYYLSNIEKSQWAQFKVEMSCASSGSSRVPLREIRLHYN